MQANAFETACLQGDLEGAKRLVVDGNYDAVTLHLSTAVMSKVVLNGHDGVVRWLIGTVGIVPFYPTRVFNCACMAGNTELCKWLISMLHLRSVEFNSGWLTACGHGQLQTAKWLFSDYRKWISSLNIDRAFKMACSNGHLELAMWMHATVDVTAGVTRFTFAWTCQNRKWPVVFWLMETFGYSLRDVPDNVTDQVVAEIASLPLVKACR